MNKVHKYAQNEINYLIKLKTEISKNKISYCELLDYNYKYYDTCTKIIINKQKYLKAFNFIPATLNKKKIKHFINNLTIDHLTLDFYFFYFDEYYSITPFMQLMALIYLLKFINIKKITLAMSIIECNFQAYDLFCKSFKVILERHCKDIDVIINYSYSSPNFITSLGYGLSKDKATGIKISKNKENYATIDKFKVNYHRNYQLKNRID